MLPQSAACTPNALTIFLMSILLLLLLSHITYVQIIVRTVKEQALHVHMLPPELKDDSKYLLCPMPGTLISCGKRYNMMQCSICHCNADDNVNSILNIFILMHYT